MHQSNLRDLVTYYAIGVAASECNRLALALSLYCRRDRVAGIVDRVAFPEFTITITINDALQECGLPGLEAQILFAHALGVSRSWLITHGADAAEQSAPAYQKFGELCARRRAGEPVAYLVGTREFYGLPIRVTPAVLIPRPETELLVDLALERLAKPDAAHVSADVASATVLDLGTGSGCVALAIAHSRPDVKVSAADISQAALQVAQGNAQALEIELAFVASDWYAALGGKRFDLIAANPPYIAPGDSHLAEGDLRFEPAGALVAASRAAPPDDGLSAIRTIVAGAPSHLSAGGWLLFEHGYDQAAACRELLSAAGFAEVRSWRDLAGIERVSGGQLISDARPAY